MLRRPATTIQITSEDVAAYEDRRAREHAQMAAAAHQQQQIMMQGSSSPENAEAQRRRAREERIGVANRQGQQQTW